MHFARVRAGCFYLLAFDFLFRWLVVFVSWPVWCVHTMCSVSGYSHKLPELTSTVANWLVAYRPTEATFTRRKDVMMRRLLNIAKSDARTIASYELDRALVSGLFHYTDQIAALESLTFTAFAAHCSSLFAQVFVDAFVYGNFSQSDAEAWGSRVSQILAQGAAICGPC